jgi:GNAT superfamily N-acetyltransferase
MAIHKIKTAKGREKGNPEINMNILNFKPLTGHPPGAIFNLLEQCYADAEKMLPEYYQKWINDWKAYDDEIFQYPDTVGACGFITYIDNVMIGFASWDPRQYPRGRVGHNGILPEFRGNGYGKLQISEVLKRLADNNFQKVSAKTMDHPFFTGAQKMYLACGFEEIKRYAVAGKNYGIIEFQKRP